MGQLEKDVRRKIRRTAVQHAVLTAIGTAGVLSLALVAPNAISALAKLGVLPKERGEEVARSAASRLRKKGLLQFTNGCYSLTPLGEKVIWRWENRDYQIDRPKKWDKKWRILIFDIPEKRKSTRDVMRRIIREAGFERLQDSVWVYPYDCEDVVTLLKTDLGISKYMLYMIVEKLENDLELRRGFKLV